MKEEYKEIRQELNEFLQFLEIPSHYWHCLGELKIILTNKNGHWSTIEMKDKALELIDRLITV